MAWNEEDGVPDFEDEGEDPGGLLQNPIVILLLLMAGALLLIGLVAWLGSR